MNPRFVCFNLVNVIMQVLRAIDPAGRIVIPVLKHVKRISELTVKCQRCWLVQS